ncbi:MAG TPA: DNA gyrase subunit A [Candidatus Fimimonas merdipullorum]|uniref:DNA gyrase subunit A n=1 Tax=Candidatus Fimimonas merdipullorum TaxID=2840822 RepID=A0A9D1SPC8_9BACT|nr:DNA gyrase subunit A [Candidatus Fimimonas merdipullorum]
MAKQESHNIDYVNALENTNVKIIKMEEEMKRSFIAYAMAVNVSRAIPDVRDGLKPVHRRILYAMGELNLYNDKPYRKCARIVGDVLGKYHPHGDSAVYGALVRLAQDFSIRCPLVDGQGNFGSVDGDGAAAQRYTEARLSKIASEMLRDIDKNTVDFYPNFDNTLMQPTVLPSRFPNLLVNGADGIAVGMATNIPPHNLSEVIDGAIAVMENPDITVEELMKIIPAPDFPSGGIIMGRMGIRNAYKTGKGSIILRAKTEIEEHDGRQRIIVTELPYQVNKAKLVETIAGMVKDKRLEGISDIRDESDRHGMRVVFDLKRDANAQVVLNSMFKQTQLQVSDGIILLALADGEPKILSLTEILQHYIVHQREVVTRRTQFDLEKAEDRRHIIEGLVIALDNIDRVIAIIKGSEDRQTAATALKEEFGLSDKQTNAILEMKLSRLTHLEVESLKRELAELDALIADLKDILARPERLSDIIKTEMTEIKGKYGQPRKTEICTDYSEIDIGDLIEREDVIISMTHLGYVKRLPVSEYHTQKRGGKGVTAHKTREEDFVTDMFISNTHDDLLFFSNKGKVYCIKGYEVPEAERTARGRAIVNLLQLDNGEKVTAVIPRKENSQGNLFMATRNGLIKKTNLEEFRSIRKTGKIAISLVEGDELIGVDMTSGDDEILMASREGKCIRFAEKDVRAMGREAQGVRSMKLNDGDYVVDMAVVRPGLEVLTVSTNGFGKRSDIDDYRLQSRAGKGIKAGVFNDKTGKLVNLKLIDPQNDVMLIANNGVVIRVRAQDISKIGRDTMGVRIMKFKGEAEVVSVSESPVHEEEAAAESAE